MATWRLTCVCVELLSSRLSIDKLLLNTYSASGRRTVHLATMSMSLRGPAMIGLALSRSTPHCSVRDRLKVVA